MTRIDKDKIVVYEEESQICEFCGKVAETRPYGKDGKEICIECAEKPENKDEVEKNMVEMIFGLKKMPYRTDFPKREK